MRGVLLRLCTAGIKALLQVPSVVHVHVQQKLRMGVSQNYGYHFGGPQSNDYSILGFRVYIGSPYLGKLPNLIQAILKFPAMSSQPPDQN